MRAAGQYRCYCKPWCEHALHDGVLAKRRQRLLAEAVETHGVVTDQRAPAVLGKAALPGLSSLGKILKVVGDVHSVLDANSESPLYAHVSVDCVTPPHAVNES